MNTVRREQMCEFIQKNEVVTLEQLTELFPKISLMTIHRDLNYLQESGFVTKIHGGAKYTKDSDNEPTFSVREVYRQSEKETIAEKALTLIEGTGSIYIDFGTTMLTLAKAMPNMRANIMTAGPNIALELARHSLTTISMCGGVLNKNNLALSGTAAEETLSTFNIDTAFLATSGYSGNTGFTCGPEAESSIKKLVIEKAQRKIMLMDSSKIGKVFSYTFADMKDFDYIITEKQPNELPEEFQKEAEKAGVTLR